MKKILFTFLVCLGTAAYSQVKIESVAISIGGQRTGTNELSVRDLHRLNPGTRLVPDSIYATGSYHSSYDGPALTARITLVPTASATFLRTTYRVGLTVSGNTPLRTGIQTRERFAYDTLRSSRDGRTYAIDSIYNTTYEYLYNSTVATLDLGVQVNTPYEKRFSGYGGLSLNVGVSSGKAKYSSTSYTYLDSEYPLVPYGLYTVYSGNVDNGGEVYKHKTSYAVGISLPIGVQFRVSKTHPAFSKMRIIAEVRPGVVIEGVSDFGRIGSRYISRSMGIQFDL